MSLLLLHASQLYCYRGHLKIITGSFHLSNVNCLLFYDAQRSSRSHSRRDGMQLLMHIVLVAYSNLGRAELR